MRVSVHGRALGFDQNNLYLNDRIVGNPLTSRGKFIYVDSAIDGASGASPAEAVGTLDEAFALCTANRGDTFVVMPNHAETVTGAGGITADVAGVTVVGLGSYNQRPRFLMDGGTTVTVVVSAADVTFRNLVFASGYADVVTCFNITGVGCWLDQVEFDDNTTDENWLTPIKATGADNTADGLKVTDCRWISADAGCLEFIEVTGNLADAVIDGNTMIVAGTASPLILTAGAKILTGAWIAHNNIQNANTANDLLIDNGGATNTGLVAYNLVGNLDVTGAQVLGAATGLQFFENYATSTSTESGAVAPAADTPNA
jgi:hypothetical protein